MINNVICCTLKHLPTLRGFSKEFVAQLCQAKSRGFSSSSSTSGLTHKKNTMTRRNKNKNKIKNSSAKNAAEDVKNNGNSSSATNAAKNVKKNDTSSSARNFTKNIPAAQMKKGKSLPAKQRPPSTINIVPIGTGGPGTSCSLLLTTEFSRYMFNCGEGTQRLAAMSKGLRSAAFAKLSGLENIFITHKSWENTGGLLGLSMTLEGQLNPESRVYVPREQGSKDAPATTSNAARITIYGPPGVEKTALMAKKFSVSANLKIVKANRTFSDSCLSIQPVPFYKDGSTVSTEKEEEQNGEPAAKRLKTDMSLSPETSVAYAYICQPTAAMGKINVEKCVDAGITIGPMVGQLQRGQSVTLDDGTVVTPEQVTDSVETERRPFLVVECPSPEFLPSLVASEEVSWLASSSAEDSFVMVVHMTPREVYLSDQYQAWMRGFSSCTDHLVLNRSAGEADLIRVRTHQAMLNLVCEDVFPVLPKSAEPVPASGVANASEQRRFLACSGMHYVYRGKNLGFQFAPDEFNHNDTQKDCLDHVMGLSEQLEEVKQTQKLIDSNREPAAFLSDDNSDSEEGVKKYPKIVFLGTGSSEPNKIRGQSCIVVQVSKHSVIILDCGEDSYGQLHRFYGQDKAARLLRKTKAIFVSHMHGDHHLGLFSLLKEREKAFISYNQPFSPVLLMAPIQMRRWLRFYHQELESITHLLRFVKHQQDVDEFDADMNLPSATYDDVRQELALDEYTPVEVDHCRNAFGVVLKHRNGFKVVYSGDTRPCDRLVAAGKNCDLLIHEATHEDALIAHAKASKHSTFSEAMDVGSRMEAKHVILTHFSQRYPHMVPFFDMKLPDNVGIAFDNMQVCPRRLGILPQLIRPLTTIFASSLQRLEIKRIKRSREQTEEDSVSPEAQGSSS